MLGSLVLRTGSGGMVRIIYPMLLNLSVENLNFLNMFISIFWEKLIKYISVSKFSIISSFSLIVWWQDETSLINFINPFYNFSWLEFSWSKPVVTLIQVTLFPDDCRIASNGGGKSTKAKLLATRSGGKELGQSWPRLSSTTSNLVTNIYRM